MRIHYIQYRSSDQTMPTSPEIRPCPQARVLDLYKPRMRPCQRALESDHVYKPWDQTMSTSPRIRPCPQALGLDHFHNPLLKTKSPSPDGRQCPKPWDQTMFTSLCMHQTMSKSPGIKPFSQTLRSDHICTQALRSDYIS